MKFQRYLRLPNEWQKSSISEHIVAFNRDEADWCIGKKSNEHDEILKELHLPRKLCVRAQIIPIPIKQEESVQVVVTMDSYRLEPYVLYQHSENELESLSRYEAMEFHLKKVIDDDECLKNIMPFLKYGTCIAKREFLVQCQHVFVESITNKATGETIITPPGLPRGRALWPYGGYYRQGGGIEKNEQVVFSASAKKWRYSDIALKKGSEWIAHGVLIDGSINREGCFMHDMRKYAINTKTWFELGEAKFRVPIGTDDKGDELCIEYKSCAIKQEDINGEIFEITFRREDNLCPLF